jgi:hypothetical protein
MARRVNSICFSGFVLLFLMSCASREPKIESYELRFKKVDHFMANEFEVGVLEFEPCILPGAYIPVYHFPVYLRGEKERDFYVNVYGSPDQTDPFKFKEVSKGFLYQQELLWVLEEKTQKDSHKILKRYDSAPSYPQIKKDVVEILSTKR